MENRTGKDRFDFLKPIKDFMTGMTGYEHALFASKKRAAVDNLVMLTLFGDLLGIPVVRSYYALRILPFCYGRLENWKRSMLRERDWTDRSFD